MDRHLIICDNIAPFSTSSGAEYLASELQKDHDVSFLLLKKPADQSMRRGLSCDVHTLQVTNRWDLALGLQLRSKLKEIRPAETHVFCEQPLKLLKLLTGCPTKRVTVHLANRWPTSSIRSRLLNQVAFGKQLHWSVTCQEIVNDLQEKNICRNVSIKPTTLPLQHTSINLSPSERASILAHYIEPQSKVRLITTVAPLNPKSRLKDLIWGSELLKAIRDDVHVAIIGGHDSGFDDHLKQLHSFIKNTDLRNHVHFLNWSSSAAEIIAASDVYCEPSGWIPDSTALQFARSCGVPTAIVGSAYNSQNYRDNKDCLMFTSGAKNEIGRKIRKLLDESEFAANISANAKSLSAFRYGNVWLDKTTGEKQVA